MAGLEDNPQPVPARPADADTDSLPADTGDTDDAEDEPEDTISQKLRRGAFGMAKWLLLVVLFILIIAGGMALPQRHARYAARNQGHL